MRSQCSGLFNALKELDLEALTAEDKEDLLVLFSCTKNHALRNLLVGFLADFVYEPALPVIFQKIMDKCNYNYTGSLVYALESFDVKDYLNELITIFLIPQSFEAIMTAYHVIEKHQHAFSEADKEKAVAVLSSYRDNEANWDLDNDLHFYIDEVISLLGS